MDRLFVIAIIAFPILCFAKVNNFNELIEASELEQAVTAREMKLQPIRTLKPIKVTKLAGLSSSESKASTKDSLGVIVLTKSSSRF